jgi:hypothetical protein
MKREKKPSFILWMVCKIKKEYILEYPVIIVVALLASLLTFYSGFGLGTLLMPVFAIFFPVDVAIALTGLVHFANNIFKVILTAKHIQWHTAFLFGLPAMLAATVGARLLDYFNRLDSVFTWYLFEKQCIITPVNLLIAILLMIFVFLEMWPGFKNIEIKTKEIVIGGLISGFFGGLSGHQGALRSAFLVKTNLSKESFIATGVIIACMIDVSRLFVYAGRFEGLYRDEYSGLVTAATLAAFAGAFAGSRLLKKVTLKHVQHIVSVALLLLAICLGAGLI